MTHDEAIEAAAMLACEYALGGKACPCRESGQFKCRDEIPGGFARAVAPLLMEHGARVALDAAVKALEEDSGLCDCFARSEGECACGAWSGYKTVPLERAVDIIHNLAPATIVREAK
jgi:hypothetical protein